MLLVSSFDNQYWENPFSLGYTQYCAACPDAVKKATISPRRKRKLPNRFFFSSSLFSTMSNIQKGEALLGKQSGSPRPQGSSSPIISTNKPLGSPEGYWRWLFAREYCSHDWKRRCCQVECYYFLSLLVYSTPFGFPSSSRSPFLFFRARVSKVK